jgi:hypothetical protein
VQPSFLVVSAGERVDVRELVGFCDQRGCDFAQLFLEVGLARPPSVHPMLGGAWGDRTREVSSLSRYDSLGANRNLDRGDPRCD